MTQVVRVAFPGGRRDYTYSWCGHPLLEVGDLVELPPNPVSPEGSTAVVTGIGSEYNGWMAQVVRKVEIDG